MSFLDRWTKRKTKDQLSAANKSESGSTVVENVDENEVKAEKVDKKKKTAKKKETVDIKKINIKDPSLFSVILKPLVSEKCAHLETAGAYTFAVNVKTNKIRVKEAVKQIYGVMPEKVRISNSQGKWVRFGGKIGRRCDWKKAVVTLPKGKTISIHEGV